MEWDNETFVLCILYQITTTSLSSELRTTLSPQHAESVLTPSVHIRSKLTCTFSGCLEYWISYRRHHIFGVRVTQIHSPCALGAGESLGKGSNENSILHPETLTNYQYFQSSWQNSVIQEMSWDRAISCPNPATHMLCVLGQVSYSFLIWTAGTCYMDSLNILPDIKSLFACHGQFGHFPPQYVHLKKSPYLLPWGQKVYLCVKSWLSLYYKN